MSYTILVADDDHALVQAVAIRLRSAGYEVVTALDSYQAIQFAREHEPDLVLLDINMPAGDGFSVQERIQRVCAQQTPVIYLTGDKSPAAREHAEALGAYALLYKPYDDLELLATVQDAIENGRLAETP